MAETVGHVSLSINAGGQETIRLTLNREGRSLLAAAASHKLWVMLTVQLGPKTVTTKALTLKTHKHKR